MTTSPVIDRPEAPAGPAKLSPAQLRAAQTETLTAPRLRYGILARVLFKATDLVYGPDRGIAKFAMLEYIARVPYQAWERIGYLALARYRRRSALARRDFERIVQTRAEQDNEQWHLLILNDLAQGRGLRHPFLRYRLNADFEDHAEHEYMASVAEHAGLEAQPDPGACAAEYGHYRSVADLLRQIGHDERIHKLDSLASLSAPRFGHSRGDAGTQQVMSE